MKEGFLKLDGQDKSQKSFYETVKNQQNDTGRLAKNIKTQCQQSSHEWLGHVSAFVGS